MRTGAALIIDRDAPRATELRALLEFLDEPVLSLAEGDDWRARLNGDAAPSAVFLGDCGSGTTLNDVIRELRAIDAETPLVLLGEHVEAAVPKAAEDAVCGRLQQPFRYGQLRQALQVARRYREAHRAGVDRRAPELFRSLVGRAPAIVQIRELVQRVAPSDATVLILGESGTGKEVVARNIHYYSARRKGPFVPVNCGAIPENLLESELFGHEKGAFTGAITARRGRFELAEGGTLFLDEIGDMPLPMQVKLLRVLQERVFERVGSSKPIAMDVRVVAATHRDLDELISAGTFREDLYYRINVFPIEMPSLASRSEDVAILAEELLERIEADTGYRVELTPAALRCLRRYAWPGNVRELANLMERLVILHGGGLVDVGDLPAKFRNGEIEAPPAETAESVMEAVQASALPEGGLDLRQHLVDLESRLIRSALEESNGIVAHAAELLRMRRTTLVEKMRKYGLRRDGDPVDG